jgi:aromatic-L-amino-acid/L-tryptophan decarboxylase
MNDLIQKLRVLEQASGELDPSENIRNTYLEKVRNYTNGFLNQISEANAYSDARVDLKDLRIGGETKTLDHALEIYQREVAGKGINPASGGHLGYIPGGGIYLSALGDYIADISNEFAGMSFASPGAVSIENEVIDWLKNIFKFPKTAVGNLCSGGSIANMIALTSARDYKMIKGEMIPKSVIYLSSQAHHSVHKALRIIGLEDVILRNVPLDTFSKMESDELEKQIESDLIDGLNPFMVIAAAGTTDTGAIDPLKKFGEICKTRDLWFHVDAAYGGFFILVNDKEAAFDGIEMADSLIVDPHKGLFLPYGVGAVLIKHKEAVMHSHQYVASYMQDAVKDEFAVNPADVSPELTKHFRGLRIWLPLQIHGIEPFIACLEEKLLLTRYFREKLMELGFELGPEPDLSVSYFWYPAKDENEFNQSLMDLIHKDGRVFLSSTLIDGRFVIRMGILAFRTKMATIDRAVEMIGDALKGLNSESDR